MLGAICGYVCEIHGSRCAVYGSIVRAGIHGCLRSRSTGSLYRPYLNLTFYELLLLDRFQYVIGELFSNYQPGTKRTCLITVI